MLLTELRIVGTSFFMLMIIVFAMVMWVEIQLGDLEFEPFGEYDEPTSSSCEFGRSLVSVQSTKSILECRVTIADLLV